MTKIPSLMNCRMEGKEASLDLTGESGKEEERGKSEMGKCERELSPLSLRRNES